MNFKCNLSVPLLLFWQLRSTIFNSIINSFSNINMSIIFLKR